MGRTSPRSYGVETEDGRVFRRNRRHLLQTREPWTADVSDDDGGPSETRSAECGAPALSSSVDATSGQPTPHTQVVSSRWCSSTSYTTPRAVSSQADTGPKKIGSHH
ncbi:hypothetical protein MRX96_056548 [Rhipicephalus microplus]